MLFYKVEGTLQGRETEERDRWTQREEQRIIKTKSEEFNQKISKQSFYFISDIESTSVTAGIITEYFDNIQCNLHKFFSYIDLRVKDITVNEIVFCKIETLLNRAERKKYIDDVESIMEKFKLYILSRKFGRGLPYAENIIQESSKEEVYSAAKKYLLDKTLIPELDRIYLTKPVSHMYGHPVHYIMQSDDNGMRKETLKLLLQALYESKRLKSRRYSILKFRKDENYYSTVYETLYKLSSGGAVIIRYLSNEEFENEEYVLNNSETIKSICDAIKRYRNQVLTIICLPKESTKVKNLFYENLGTLSMIEFLEESLLDERATDFLKRLAKEAGIRTDKKLFSKLEDNKGYLASELHDIFDSWYNNKLKISVYPQYKDVAVVGEKVVKTAPRVSAYKELYEMIGLTEAKHVIKNALNYYKMQKVYAEKGLKQDRPAMHMIFTGNPGTAKTTVARLFAQIMKDNGLLSKGQLIEVGRADLVGKYVGWTAPTVKSKFKAAFGGVLFIDEAYSLVEDKDGLYGDEAINTIVQEMENHRDNVVVIFAGYTDKMEVFLEKNPGLRSRIAFRVPFPDYDLQELCDIAKLICKKKGLKLSQEAEAKLNSVFEIARQQADFGNGRYVRNILEQARMAQATRLMEVDFKDITTEELATINAEDIKIPEIKLPKKQRIGFGV